MSRVRFRDRSPPKWVLDRGFTSLSDYMRATETYRIATSGQYNVADEPTYLGNYRERRELQSSHSGRHYDRKSSSYERSDNRKAVIADKDRKRYHHVEENLTRQRIKDEQWYNKNYNERKYREVNSDKRASDGRSKSTSSSEANLHSDLSKKRCQRSINVSSEIPVIGARIIGIPEGFETESNISSGGRSEKSPVRQPKAMSEGRTKETGGQSRRSGNQPTATSSQQETRDSQPKVTDDLQKASVSQVKKSANNIKPKEIDSGPEKTDHQPILINSELKATVNQTKEAISSRNEFSEAQLNSQPTVLSRNKDTALINQKESSLTKCVDSLTHPKTASASNLREKIVAESNPTIMRKRQSKVMSSVKIKKEKEDNVSRKRSSGCNETPSQKPVSNTPTNAMESPVLGADGPVFGKSHHLSEKLLNPSNIAPLKSTKSILARKYCRLRSVQFSGGIIAHNKRKLQEVIQSNEALSNHICLECDQSFDSPLTYQSHCSKVHKMAAASPIHICKSEQQLPLSEKVVPRNVVPNDTNCSTVTISAAATTASGQQNGDLVKTFANTTVQNYLHDEDTVIARVLKSSEEAKMQQNDSQCNDIPDCIVFACYCKLCCTFFHDDDSVITVHCESREHLENMAAV